MYFTELKRKLFFNGFTQVFTSVISIIAAFLKIHISSVVIFLQCEGISSSMLMEQSGYCWILYFPSFVNAFIPEEYFRWLIFMSQSLSSFVLVFYYTLLVTFYSSSCVYFIEIVYLFYADRVISIDLFSRSLVIFCDMYILLLI